MAKLTGRNGVLRILDAARIVHGQAPLDNLTIKIVKWDGAAAWTDITSDVEADDGAAASAFVADNDDAVFIGSTSRFAMIQYLKDFGTNYGAGTGALKGFYFDGTDFATALTGLVDGTASGGDCFAADGNISFKIPSNWAIGANAVNAALTSTMYFVKLMTTTSGTTDPDADVLAPIDGQYKELIFAGMDFNGPLGRTQTEEQLVLNRGIMDAYAHYIEGDEVPLMEPLEFSASCLIDTSQNDEKIFAALECANPGASRWTATGTTTKGTTKNDGTNLNPAFAETAKKTCNVHMLWDFGSGRPIGVALYEVYFNRPDQSFAESQDAITLEIKGAIYGLIEIIHGIANRY